MAIALSQSATATQKEGSSPATATIPTTGQASDDYVLVGYTGNAAPTAVTFDGTAMTLIGTGQASNPYTFNLYGLRLRNETGGAVSVTYTGGGDTALVCARFTGVHTTTAILQNDGNIDGGQNTSFNFDTTGGADQLISGITDGSTVLTFVGGGNGPGGFSHTGHSFVEAGGETASASFTYSLTPSPAGAGTQETGTVNYGSTYDSMGYTTIELQRAAAASLSMLPDALTGNAFNLPTALREEEALPSALTGHNLYLPAALRESEALPDALTGNAFNLPSANVVVGASPDALTGHNLYIPSALPETQALPDALTGHNLYLPGAASETQALPDALTGHNLYLPEANAVVSASPDALTGHNLYLPVVIREEQALVDALTGNVLNLPVASASGGASPNNLTGNAFNIPTAGVKLATAIGCINFVDREVVATTLQTGVVAFHKDGISKVEFTFGTDAAVVVTQMTDNPASGVRDYNTTFTASNYSDGLVTYSIEIFPVTGTNLVLSGSLMADNGGTLFSGVKFVSTTGNDTTGTGTQSNPYATIAKGMQDLVVDKGDNDIGGGTIFLEEGTHEDPTAYPGVNRVTSTYMTVKAAAGASRGATFLDITSGTAFGMRVQRTKYEGITVKTGLTGRTTVGTGFESQLWCHDVVFLGDYRTDDFLTQDGNWGLGVAMTDCISQSRANGFKETAGSPMNLVRGCYVNHSAAVQYHNLRATVNCVGTDQIAVNAVNTGAASAAGTGYFAGDTITVSTGSPTLSATFSVDTVGASGEVLTVTRTHRGVYPLGSEPSSPSATTGGTGSGCTLTLTMFDYHQDVWLNGVTSDNVILYGFRGFDTYGQSIAMLDAPKKNFALVNVCIENTATTGLYSSLNQSMDHMVMDHVTLTGRNWNWDGTSGPYDYFDISVRNCIFEDGYGYISPTVEADIPDGDNNHFETAVDAPASWTNNSTGVIAYVDETGNDWSIVSGTAYRSGTYSPIDDGLTSPNTNYDIAQVGVDNYTAQVPTKGGWVNTTAATDVKATVLTGHNLYLPTANIGSAGPLPDALTGNNFYIPGVLREEEASVDALTSDSFNIPTAAREEQALTDALTGNTLGIPTAAREEQASTDALTGHNLYPPDAAREEVALTDALTAGSHNIPVATVPGVGASPTALTGHDLYIPTAGSSSLVVNVDFLDYTGIGIYFKIPTVTVGIREIPAVSCNSTSFLTSGGLVPVREFDTLGPFHATAALTANLVAQFHLIPAASLNTNQNNVALTANLGSTSTVNVVSGDTSGADASTALTATLLRQFAHVTSGDVGDLDLDLVAETAVDITLSSNIQGQCGYIEDYCQDTCLLEVWNIATSMLSLPAMLSATENTSHGAAVRAIWHLVRRKFFSDHDWNSNKVTEVLVVDATVTPAGRWDAAWTLPPCCLRVLFLNGYENQPASNVLWEIELEPVLKRSKLLYTDEPTVKIEYIADIENVGLLAPGTAHALGLELAKHLAPRFGKSVEETRQIAETARQALSAAKSVDSMEQHPVIYGDESLHQARY